MSKTQYTVNNADDKDINQDEYEALAWLLVEQAVTKECNARIEVNDE